MYVSTEQVKKIIRSCNLEFGYVHKVTGWDHYIAVYRLDNIKITFKVKSANTRQNTLDLGLINELKSRIGDITLGIDESFSAFNRCIYNIDPYSVLPLVNKYLIGQYTDSINKKAE